MGHHYESKILLKGGQDLETWATPRTLCTYSKSAKMQWGLYKLKIPCVKHTWASVSPTNFYLFPVKQRQPTADIDAHNEQESADLLTDSIPTCRRIRNYTGDIPVLFVSMWKKLTWNSKPTFPNTTSLVLRSFVINRKVQIRSFCCKGIVGCSTPGPATRRDP